MKIAVVHDYLCAIAGSERVFKYICEEFSEADVYTLAYNSNKTFPYFSSRKINTTWLNYFVRSTRAFRWSFPIATYEMELLNLNKYDVVLSSSATVAKYIRVRGKHICYCYIPTRALWQNQTYFEGSIIGLIVKPFLPYLRERDFRAAQAVDSFLAISKDSQSHIKKTYKRDSDVVFSPIELDKFEFSTSKSDYYLIVSRLEKWKRVDYAIEAFNKLGLPLRIVGVGEEERTLRKMANSNIYFCGSINDEVLAEEYSKAKAVVFTPTLEYGLVPLEAIASGTPVIGLGSGGIKETMIPWSPLLEDSAKFTAVFFDEPTSESLVNAVKTFQTLKFDSQFLFEHAKKWDVPMFKKKLREIVLSHCNPGEK